MTRIFFTILLSILLSCSDFIDTWDAYEIRQGQHFSHRTGMPKRLLSLQDGRHMKFDAYFTNSCLYEPSSDDINKLYGFTDANSSVHKNSVRFGWRHDGKGTIEIFAYWYADGVRGVQRLGETLPYQKDTYEIWARNGYYNFWFNNVEFTVPRKHDPEHGVRVRLFPYFGGNDPAPNDILIFIREHS